MYWKVSYYKQVSVCVKLGQYNTIFGFLNIVAQGYGIVCSNKILKPCSTTLIIVLEPGLEKTCTAFSHFSCRGF